MDHLIEEEEDIPVEASPSSSPSTTTTIKLTTPSTTTSQATTAIPVITSPKTETTQKIQNEEENTMKPGLVTWTNIGEETKKNVTTEDWVLLPSVQPEFTTTRIKVTDNMDGEESTISLVSPTYPPFKPFPYGKYINENWRKFDFNKLIFFSDFETTVDSNEIPDIEITTEELPELIPSTTIFDETTIKISTASNKVEQSTETTNFEEIPLTTHEIINNFTSSSPPPTLPLEGILQTSTTAGTVFKDNVTTASIQDLIESTTSQMSMLSTTTISNLEGIDYRQGKNKSKENGKFLTPN